MAWWAGAFCCSGGCRFLPTSTTRTSRERPRWLGELQLDAMNQKAIISSSDEANGGHLRRGHASCLVAALVVGLVRRRRVRSKGHQAPARRRPRTGTHEKAQDTNYIANICTPTLRLFTLTGVVFWTRNGERLGTQGTAVPGFPTVFEASSTGNPTDMLRGGSN